MSKFLDETGLVQVMSAIRPGLIKVINNGETIDITASTTKTGLYLFKDGATLQLTDALSETLDIDMLVFITIVSKSTNYVEVEVAVISYALLRFNVTKTTNPSTGVITYTINDAISLQTTDMVTSIGSSSNNTTIPTAKAVYDLFNDGMDEIGTLIGTVSSS